ncbi:MULTISPECIES: c-type cytochrome biogenesis protein CcsB [Geobacter]|uniref:Heme exporter protein C n=2 Tax=Geobacter TaxID=28231 RepID=A0A0C1QSP9_9BACT|nr:MULTISPECIES: c-type cytochrome biogenesis protein CcsB [Geobacter]ANA39545.1 c-type cytochrome biogenesis protein CcsB [Geobacter anodireducens]KIE41291.1 cytochrome C biogenesis protein ResC [Geobacter soli]MBE2888579.1 c-type cytochrome biogenesis protein CcsB [Geobacter anodireducens]HMN03071.1 c-type cytochrome biogenesis protein CcsB [Geobacter anodireducens]
MTSSMLFNITTFSYLVSMLAFFAFLASRNRHVGMAGSLISYFGFFVHTAAILLRWKESYDIGHGHAPLSNLYESVVFFAWTIVLIFGIIDLKYKYRVVGAFVMPFALLGMAWAQLTLNSGIEPLVPALQSNWLLYHVVTCFLGYAAFAVACGISIMYLIKAGKEDSSQSAQAGGIISMFPPTKILDDLNYKAIMIGFPLLTLGIITGAAWANYAWGTYWSWDPKETWSLIVWFVYAAFLHARFTRGWVGKRAAILSIVGFAATIFCYLGVNLLLSGLHSYGGG